MDETRDETPEDLDEPPPLVPEAPNRYAVPLTVLVGGAYVAVTDQVTLQDELASPGGYAGTPYLDGGGTDVDGD